MGDPHSTVLEGTSLTPTTSLYVSHDGTDAGRTADFAAASQRHRTVKTTVVVFHTISLIRIGRDKVSKVEL